MKRFFVVVYFIFQLGFLYAQTYYVSSRNGDDRNNGRSPETAWKTINEVNRQISTIRAGNSVLFERGGIYYGSIAFPTNTNVRGLADSPIIFGAYGNGNLPVISGAKQISNWVQINDNQWKASVPDRPQSIDILFINGKKYYPARYPNSGYLHVTDYYAKGLQDKNLKFPDGYWNSATITFRDADWEIYRDTVVHSYSDGRIEKNGINTNKTPTSGWGYFFQNHIKALDILGEWVYNKREHTLILNTNTDPNKQIIEYSDADYGIKIDFRGSNNKNSFIIIENLCIQNYRNSIINAIEVNYLTIRQNIIRNTLDGIYAGILDNCQISNNTITDVETNGLKLANIKNSRIHNNTIRRIAISLDGGQNGMENCYGIFIGSFMSPTQPNNNVEITGNRIDSIGYSGIRFHFAQDMLIKNNMINYSMLNLSDGGGIYTWKSNNDNILDKNRPNKIIDNVVLNTIGNDDGSANKYYNIINRYIGTQFGIYLDDDIANLIIEGNTVVNSGRGIFFHGSQGNRVRKNVLFNNIVANIACADTDDNSFLNNEIKRNYMYGQNNGSYSGLSAPYLIYYLYFGVDDSKVASTNQVDSNYISAPFSANFGNIKGRLVNKSTLTSRLNFDVHSFSEPFSYENSGASTPSEFAILAYNSTSKDTTILLDHSYVSFEGVRYNGSIHLEPFKSAILFKCNDVLYPIITITAHPTTTTSVTAGSITGNLSVTATATQNATLSYQWYSNTTNSNNGGTAISGATNASFAIPTTLTAGTYYYYYCEVRDTGGATSLRSNVATVNVAAPVPTPVITITTQPASTTNVTASSITGSLSVTANVTQSATLSYQWYSNTSNNTNGGTAISNATNATFAIPTTLTAGTYYYFCEVRATGATSIRSNVASVIVYPTPVITITAQPASTTSVTAGSITGSLSVTASVTQGATLSYQWYSNTTNSNNGGTAISGATNASFAIPATLAAGTYYYFCEVRATGGANSVRSNGARVNIAAPTPVITITTHPTATTSVTAGSISGSLSVAASVTQGATLSYQWYRNTTNSSTGGTSISGATNASFTIPTTLAASGSPYYYFCEVRATGGATSIRSTVARVNVAAPTPVIIMNVHPVAITNVTAGSISGSLSITASVTEGATLSYQWYSNTTDSNEGGTVISNATNRTFTIPTTLAASGSPYYYFCEVRATGGAISVRSDAAMINVTAPTPVITISAHPTANTNVTQGAVTGNLSVTARVTQSAAISYQWYENSSSSNEGGQEISGATNRTFTIPKTLEASDEPYYYFCEVRATNGAISVRSHVAAVMVSTLEHAQSPTITARPQSAIYDHNATATAFNVEASVDDNGVLSYQWYRNTTNSNTGGTWINGATVASYLPPTSTVGTLYYYVIVTNTNNSVNGTKTATITSNTATVTVIAIVDALAPNIISHPKSETLDHYDPASALSVTASVSDDGTISYQWYSNSENSISGGTPISNAVDASYTPPTTTVGTLYYYVIVTNTNNSVNGIKTATTTSNTATVTVNAIVDAVAPTIISHPQSATYDHHAPATVLNVTVSVDDGGIISYQWYSNTADSNAGGILVNGATVASYTPSTSTVGTIYYFVVVANTNDKVNGTQIATTTSNTTEVTVNAIVNAVIPNIISHPQSATYHHNITASELNVAATVDDGGVISYQWYGNTTDSNTDGILISGATGASYSPPTTSVGLLYYYVIVTNTNNSVNGTKTATITSNTATVTVNSLEFATHDDLNTVYTPTLTLADLNTQLSNGYAWINPSTQLRTGDHQQFPATYSAPDWNYQSVTGDITVNVAKANQMLTASNISITTADRNVVNLSGHAASSAGASGGEITYILTNAGTTGADLAGAILSLRSTGEATISVSTAGNENYHEATTSFKLTASEFLYAVAVESEGTGATGDGEYGAGSTVSIYAGISPDGQRFKIWTSTNDNLIFTDATSASARFVMPSNDVTVKAVFEIENGAPEAFPIPEFFTPNGDGFNDTWNIPWINDYPEAMITIYDRAKRLIMELKGAEMPWNGCDRNDNLFNSGYYYYQIELQHGGSKPITGYVTIMR